MRRIAIQISAGVPEITRGARVFPKTRYPFSFRAFLKDDSVVLDFGLRRGIARRPDFLLAELVITSIQRNPRHPVREGWISPEAVDYGEDFHENVLGQILLIRRARQVTAHDADDLWIQRLHHLTGSRPATIGDVPGGTRAGRGWARTERIAFGFNKGQAGDV